MTGLFLDERCCLNVKDMYAASSRAPRVHVVEDKIMKASALFKAGGLCNSYKNDLARTKEHRLTLCHSWHDKLDISRKFTRSALRGVAGKSKSEAAFDLQAGAILSAR